MRLKGSVALMHDAEHKTRTKFFKNKSKGAFNIILSIRSDE